MWPRPSQRWTVFEFEAIDFEKDGNVEERREPVPWRLIQKKVVAFDEEDALPGTHDIGTRPRQIELAVE